MRRPRAGLSEFVERIREGRFERLLSGLAGVAAVVTGLEIYFEHDRASFGNRWMWAPVLLTPPMLAASIGGVMSRRVAKVVLPAISAVVVANGLQGTYLHVRGILRRPGGLREASYNIEMGPPLMAPLLVTVVGGMGVLAALLRRED
jgi:hypothetical protein